MSFASVMMVGRQNCSVAREELLSALRRSDFSKASIYPAVELVRQSGFVEPLLYLLGATTIESLDFSNYEGATTIHDLNTPIPDDLKNKFSCVLDAGTLEHVFDFPTAIKNCMEMVAVNGHFVSIAPVNNFAGHGFYQFSPELYYRIFSAPNGFAIEEMIICETWRGAPWYRVADPEIVGARIEFVNHRPTYIMIKARRLSRTGIFQALPQQSDYTVMWSHRAVGVATKLWRKRLRQVKALIPEPAKKLLRPLNLRVRPFRGAAFEKINARDSGRV